MLGQKALFSAKPLNLSLLENPDIPERLPRFTFDVVLDEREVTYAISFKLVARIDLNSIQLYFDGSIGEPPLDAIQALDIILRHGPTLFKIPIGNSLYPPAAIAQNRQDIDGGRELAYGFYQSVKTCFGGAMLSIDRSATCFYAQSSLLRFIAKVLKVDMDRCLQEKWTDAMKKKVRDELKGLEIQVSHLTYKRKYKIVGISQEETHQLSFDFVKTGQQDQQLSTEKKTVIQFFRETYKRDVRYANLPCLQVGSEKKPSYMPLEFCELVPDQHVRKGLTPDQSAKMIRAAASQQPHQRLSVIRDAAKQIADDSKKFRAEFGIAMRNTPLSIEARVLEVPEMTYANTTVKPFDGKWDMKRRRFHQPVRIENW